MTEDSQATFLDVPQLLERSQPRMHTFWPGYILGTLVLVALLSAYLSSRSVGAAKAIEVISPIVMIAIVGVMMLLTSLAMQRRRTELRQLEAIEELVQLRRWGEAALLLEGLLSQPTRTPAARAQALIFLASVLARYHRFEDAIAVQNHLLEHVQFDDGTEYGLKLAKAMAMLREDHLVDADRALSELRRLSQGRDSAGLALVEIYRDVKTGHPEEAIQIFNEMLGPLRDQLGQRVGDVYALAAKAYDMLGRETEARSMYEKATLLGPLVELHRRYPEVASLADKYPRAAAPAEVAG